MTERLTPSISVITATYNASEYLPRLIRSLVAQTNQEFEWVVADGGSTDTTLEILEKSRRQLNNVLIDSRPDFGIYDALNRAVKLAGGVYYLVVGSDDVLDPSAVANFKKLGSETGADILTAAVSFRNGTVVVRGPRGPAWWSGQMAYIAGHSVGAAFRKSLHDQKSIGYYSKAFPIAADQLFVKRAIQSGATVALGDFLAGRFGENGVSSVNTAGALSEFFRVQLETEQWKSLQVALYILRLIKNFPRLLR